MERSWRHCASPANPQPVYFELKYTESKFSDARADADHVDKFHRVYQPRLDGRFEESYCREPRFLANDQIVRNIWHLDGQSGDAVVFLFPRANSLLRKQEAIIRSCALEPFKSRVRIVYLEDLLSWLQRDSRCSEVEIASWTEFQSKYFPHADVPITS